MFITSTYFQKPAAACGYRKHGGAGKIRSRKRL